MSFLSFLLTSLPDGLLPQYEKNTADWPEVFVDINTRAAIAFGLAIIAGLLTYIAFFK